MAKAGTTDVFHEIPELFAESRQDFILVLHGFYRSCVISRAAVSHCAFSIPSRNGMSSSLVLSAPKASAIVESRLMALRRRSTSSCCASPRQPVCLDRFVDARSLMQCWGLSDL